MTDLEKVLSDLGLRPSAEEKSRILQGAREEREAALRLAQWLARQ